MAKITAVTSFKQSLIPMGDRQYENAEVPYYKDPNRMHSDEAKESKILPKDWKTKTKIKIHEFSNTLSTYPARGFSGDKNFNFYEYLTLGMFPYITGSLTFMALFNAASKYFNPKDAKAASKYGFGMALGVIFYGLAKSLSKKVISKSVALKTGIDMDTPYIKVVDLIPESPDKIKNKKLPKNKDDLTEFEYHKAFESVDFPRTDLLYSKTGNRNKYYDMIAEKNGFGTNLTDSDQEVRPFMKEVVTKARTAQNLSQYLWATIGVGLGVQEPWTKLLDIPKYKYSGVPFGKHVLNVLKTTKDAFFESCKSFYNGGVEGIINKKAKYAGRTILAIAVLTTALGIFNAVRNPYIKNDKNMKNTKIFNDDSKVKED